RTTKLQRPRRWSSRRTRRRPPLLTLPPGKTGRLPTSDSTPMPLIIERPFESPRHVLMSGEGPEADIRPHRFNVAEVPKAGLARCESFRQPLRAYGALEIKATRSW